MHYYSQAIPSVKFQNARRFCFSEQCCAEVAEVPVGGSGGGESAEGSGGKKCGKARGDFLKTVSLLADMALLWKTRRGCVW